MLNYSGGPNVIKVICPTIGFQTIAYALNFQAFLGNGDGAYVNLFIAPAQPDIGITFADFTFPTWPDYVQSGMTLNISAYMINTSGGLCTMSWPFISFMTQFGVVPANNVYGYFVSDADGNILWVGIFETPIVVTNPGDSVSFVPTFSFFSQNQ